MATRGTFTLSGLDGYLEDLANATENVDESVKEVLDTAGDEVVAEMTRLVPVDTGNLREHVEKDGPHQEGNFVFVQVGVIDADKDTAIYGNVIEYGSARVAAQPYIRPALRSKKGVVKKVLKQVLEKYGLKTS